MSWREQNGVLLDAAGCAALDDRLTADLRHCLFCEFHEGRVKHQPLREIVTHCWLCDRCLGYPGRHGHHGR